jgi:nucleoside-diphosphate-sugar epimerase
MSPKELKNFLVHKSASIKEAMKAIDRGSFGIVFIVDGKKLFGVATDGDVRRAIMNGFDIQKPVELIANKNPLKLVGDASPKTILAFRKREDVQGKMPLEGSLKIPILDKAGNIRDIIFLSGLNKSTNKKAIGKLVVKKILITGGAGYLGSVLSRKLLKAGYRVRVLDNLTYGDHGIKNLYGQKNFEFMEGDVRNISHLTQATKGMDAVIHLSAIVGDSASQLDSERTIEINYLSAKAIAEACKFNQINKFLFASTCSVYGASKNPNDRLHENSPLNPVSLYAQTKLKSEEGILSMADENFSPTIFRFATLYGVSPRMRFDLVVNVMTANALKENKIKVFGGKQWRPNLDVSDAADACMAWVKSPIEKTGGHIFNVGGNKHNIQIGNLAGIVKKIIPAAKIEKNENSIDQRDYNISFDKIKAVMAFTPKKTIAQGVQEIKKILQDKTVQDFAHHQYSNYGFLASSKPVSNTPIQRYKS